MVAGRSGAYVMGGRTASNQPDYILPGRGSAQPSAQQQTAQWSQAAGEMWYIDAQNTEANRMNETFPPLFAHACVWHNTGMQAYCTGGFRSDNSTPYHADDGMWTYGVHGVHYRPLNSPVLRTGNRAARGFHASAIISDMIYVFGGVDCLYCNNNTLYNASETVRHDVSTGLTSFHPVPLGNGPRQLLGSCAVKLRGNQILLIGGAEEVDGRPSPLRDQLWLFDPTNETQPYVPVRDATGSGPQPMWGATCGRAWNSTDVIVHGGCDPSGADPTDGAVYVLKTERVPFEWTKVDAPAVGGGAGG
ncbi:hypothetical protein HK097_000904, partial [Rhizophlyctis rosea]